MIVAGLNARGETVIYDEGHIRRGYEEFDSVLRSLGADIDLSAEVSLCQSAMAEQSSKR